MNERCQATQYSTNPVHYHVNPPFVKTDDAGWYFDQNSVATMDATIKTLVPYYADTNSICFTNISTLSVTGLFVSFPIGNYDTEVVTTNIDPYYGWETVVTSPQGTLFTSEPSWIDANEVTHAPVYSVPPPTGWDEGWDGPWPEVGLWRIYSQCLEERYKTLNALAVFRGTVVWTNSQAVNTNVVTGDSSMQSVGAYDGGVITGWSSNWYTFWHDDEMVWDDYIYFPTNPPVITYDDIIKESYSIICPPVNPDSFMQWSNSPAQHPSFAEVISHHANWDTGDFWEDFNFPNGPGWNPSFNASGWGTAPFRRQGPYAGNEVAAVKSRLLTVTNMATAAGGQAVRWRGTGGMITSSWVWIDGVYSEPLTASGRVAGVSATLTNSVTLWWDGEYCWTDWKAHIWAFGWAQWAADSTPTNCSSWVESGAAWWQPDFKNCTNRYW